MPGLAGVLTIDRPIENADKILKIIRDVQLVSGIAYLHRTYQTKSAVISNTLTGLLKTALIQPATDSSGNTVLFLEGEIFNHKELLDSVDEKSDSSQCGTLLALFRKYGDGFILRVSGEFNLLVYQKAEARLSIYSDHIASMPMYYMESGGRLFFGSEKKCVLALLDSSPDIDPVGMLQIFAHRHNLDERTFLRGLRRMMPGTQLVYDHAGAKVSRYQTLEFHIPSTVAPIGELIERWADHLRVATAKRLVGKERVLISLSAGLDSRAVACAIARDFRPVSSRTRGTAEALEPILAAKIADRLGFDHFHEDPYVGSHSQFIPKIAWRIECEVHFSNGISLSNHSAIKERGDFIVGGWLGDASSGGHISPAFLRPCSRDEFVERTYHRYLVYRVRALSSIFTNQFLTENFPKLREAFITSFESLTATTNIQLFEIWDLYQRQRRMTTSSMPVDSYAFEKVRPFYDKDYLNFTFTLPSRYRFGQILYQAMICQIGPEISDIPSANSGLRLHKSILRNAVNKGLTVSRRVVTKVGEKMHLRDRQHGLSEDLGVATRRDIGFRRLIEDFMASTDFDATIFNRAAIANMLDQHYQNTADRSYELGYVATFAAGLPYFLNKTLRCPEEADPLL